jgi:CRP-like cAMP-binding protein
MKRKFLRKRRRVFPSTTLKAYHARLVSLRKDQILVHEGDQATDYFQVESGAVKMISMNPDGKEFIQGIFNKGESFGEPALIGNFPYPGSVMAIEPAQVWRMASDYFLTMLKENFELHWRMDQVLCQRLRYKSMVLSEISCYEPEHRILSMLNYYKEKITTNTSEKIIIPYTRQQLADMTGLRVETVIRTVKKMDKEKKLKLEGHKIKL